MPNKFEVTDPRGRIVICTEERWRWHIVSGHGKFMEGYEEEVKQAIQTPVPGIYQDTQRKVRHNYYLRLPHSRKYIKVVVDFTDETNGQVITAFKADSVKAGEILIWPISTDS
jgi:hypothetical protein